MRLQLDAQQAIAQTLANELSRLPKRPTMVVSLGGDSVEFANIIAGLANVPLKLSVEKPVVASAAGLAFGVVSGSDDFAFWNENLIRDLGISQDVLQAQSQSARIEAMREVKSFASKGFKSVQSELDREIILGVLTSPLQPYTRYQLALLRQRRPEQLILLADDATLLTLAESGLAEECIPLQRFPTTP